MRKYSLWNTLKVNFRALPFRQAVRLPIYVGPHFETSGLTRGSIEIAGGRIHRKMILLGASRSFLFGHRGVWTYLRFGKGARLVLGDGVEIYQGATLVMPGNGRIEIGAGTRMNAHTLLYATSRISIGRDCMIGWNVQIMDGDAHFVYSKATNSVGARSKPIVLGDRVWIASGCTVRKGAALPDRSILAGNSLLTRDFSALTSRVNVFVGSPAALKATDCHVILRPQLERELRDRCAKEGDVTLRMPEGFEIENYL